MANSLSIRASSATDASAVDKLLEASYPALMARAYDVPTLSAALPLMTKADPALLTSMTYYVAERAGGELVGCGGWTKARPGSGDIVTGLGHLRHFGTHPDCIGQGIGRALFTRCKENAAQYGVTRFECYASRNAEGFYRALGFQVVAPLDVEFGAGVTFPSTLMDYDFN